MTEKGRELYRRIASIVKRALAEGSTIRALLLSLPPGAVLQEWIAPDRLPLWMFAAAILAAFIPDDLGGAKQ